MASSDFIAIDIGRRTIKLVQMNTKNEKSSQLIAIGSSPFPQQLQSVIPTKDNPEGMQMLADTLKSLVETSGAKTAQVITSLPESVVFSKLFPALPFIDAAKFEETIYWEAKQFIPIPIEEAQTDWIEIERRKGPDGRTVVDVMFIAAPREIVENYLQVFELAGLELIALEVESVALSRTARFNYPGNQNNSLIIDIGSERSTVCIVHNGRLVFSQSIGTGSDSFTKAIAADFGLQMGQAEQYKMRYGVLSDQADGGKIYNSIKPIMEVVMNEIHKIVGFIDSRMTYGTPQVVFVSGNGALMPGIAQYMQANLNIPVTVMDALANVKLKGKMKDIKSQVATPGYSVAVGLGLKSE